MYILDNYEILIGTCHYSWCFTTQIRGGLTDLLSSRWKLPNAVYILFSNDQVEEAEILDGETYKVLNDLFTFINRSIIERRTNLPHKAKRRNPPEVTVVKTVAKSIELLNKNNFKNKRRTFNRALQKTAQNFKWRSINIDAIVPTEKDNFDENGDELSERGLKSLWHFLSEDSKGLYTRNNQDYDHGGSANNKWINKY